jgi:branched-chain amino acid transport system ATP-binding protein
VNRPVLSVEKLKAWYGAAQILFDLAFHVDRGEVVALMGRNGAGKSTTMKTLMGLIARRSGTVRFRERDISNFKPYQVVRLGLGWVPEDRRIFTDLTVLENLDVGRQSRGAGSGAESGDEKAAPGWTPEKLFQLFPNLAEMQDRPGGRMSGGEQQMLTVARTLMGNPHMVLLDEPSEGVAPVIVEQMANTIIELKKQGLSILLSEQNLHFAELVSDRVYLLEKGHIVWEGTMAVLAADTEVQRQFLTM